MAVVAAVGLPMVDLPGGTRAVALAVGTGMVFRTGIGQAVCKCCARVVGRRAAYGYKWASKKDPPQLNVLN